MDDLASRDAGNQLKGYVRCKRANPKLIRLQQVGVVLILLLDLCTGLNDLSPRSVFSV
jgi:hypothetical protein